MKADGLSLLAGSSIESFSFDSDSRGLAFPSNPTQGQQWELTADNGNFIKGNYTYFNEEWKFNGLSNLSAYDVVGGSIGVLEDDAVLTRFTVPRTIHIPANSFGAVASALVASDTDKTLSIVARTVYNIVQIGTIVFSAGSIEGLVSFDSQYATDGYVVLYRGDVLEVTLSGVADVSLADISYTISGFLNT